MSLAEPPITPRSEEPTEVLGLGQTFESVTDTITDVTVRRRPGHAWMFGAAIAFALVMLLTGAVAYLISVGVGIWGVNIPVAWAFAIVNFVWWIGIGHAGTFISAMLLLMRQDWRTSINRFAEAMTLFAVMCAGMFPLLHLGRPWKFFWLLPYPNTMELWPQFRSPLVWDVFAVSTYFTISLLFWYVGLVPDLATARDHSPRKWQKVIFGMAALGWRGASKHWKRYQTAYLLLGALAAPLVISVHSVVGMDFSGSIVPGWHSTIFPPYFVGGAIFSGFAMVLTLAIPLRWAYGLQEYVTLRHIEGCCKLMLVTGLVVAYGYGIEGFMSWYSGETYDSFMQMNRLVGPYAWAYYVLMFCNVLTPQLLWFRAVRRNIPLVFVLSLIIQVGMWTERFVIVITSLSRDYLPTNWGMYYPTFWDYATLFGTIGFFTLAFLLFAKCVPVISMSEMRDLVEETDHGRHKMKDFHPKYAE